MAEESTDYKLNGLEARIAALENRIFGDQLHSKQQQQRKVFKIYFKNPNFVFYCISQVFVILI